MLTLVGWILIAGLANYKASHMLSQDGDDGPFDLFKRIRDRAGTTTWVGRGLHCFSCVSFWGALVAVLLMNPGVTWGHFLLVWAAVSTVSFMIWRYFG